MTEDSDHLLSREEELAAELESLRARRAAQLATKQGDDLEHVRVEAAKGLESNRVLSDKKLDDRSDHARMLAIDLAERGLSREREASAKREEVARSLAYETGFAAAATNARFGAIESHQLIVNGSIEKTGKQLESLETKTAEKLDGLETKIDDLVLEQAKRDSAAVALAADVAKRQAGQVTSRQFFFSCAGLGLGIPAVFIAISKLFP